MAKEPRDAYGLILDGVDQGLFAPGMPLVESDLADMLKMSRTPIREALQRLETQGILRRDGRSLIVSSLSHEEMGELYAVRGELEGLAARLAAQHASAEEVSLLREMVIGDRAVVDVPEEMSRANRRLHHQIHLASHNRYLIQLLGEVHRQMALLVRTTLGPDGRAREAQTDHEGIVDAIARRDGDAACDQIREHISLAYKTRLKIDLGEVS